MHHSTVARISQRRKPARTLLSTLLPAAALGLGVWLAPSDSHAAPRCTSKPAVCARLAAAEKQREAPRPAPMLAAATVTPRCTTKPTVCARLDAQPRRAPQPPVTLAQSGADGSRCTTKPAVCARLKMRPTAAPITLAENVKNVELR